MFYSFYLVFLLSTVKWLKRDLGTEFCPTSCDNVWNDNKVLESEYRIFVT